LHTEDELDSHGMIHVIATIELTPGGREAFLKEFHALVPHVHAEDGCIAYGPAVDVASGIPLQGALRKDVVTVVEQWRDVAALQAHLVAPHMQAYRGKVKDLVRGTQLQVLEPA
jgi:quinol monooxygenase YgiN